MLRFALVLFVALVWSEGASAFCIYNETPFTLTIHQWGGGKTLKDFHKTLKPGKSACCNWKNKDCNRKGKRDNLLKFRFVVEFSGKKHIEDQGWMRQAYCGEYDDKDRYRVVKALAGSAIVLHHHGHVPVGQHLGRDDLQVYSWELDGAGLRYRESCFIDERKYHWSDFFQ